MKNLKNHVFFDFPEFLDFIHSTQRFQWDTGAPVGGPGSPKTSFPEPERVGGMPGIDVGVNFEKSKNHDFPTKNHDF